MKPKSESNVSLYLHVPFCRARCLYCSFPTRPAGPTTQTAYIENLCRELDHYFETNPEYNVVTVYVGGGTPSTLGLGDIENLLRLINSIAPEAVEISFEVNPHPDDLVKIPILHEHGVNRLSIGVQTFNDNELSIIGRLHDSKDARLFLRECMKVGFDSISIDLIHGLPGQTLNSFRDTLEEAVSYDPQHVSLYSLSIETDSRLGKLNPGQFRKLQLPDDDRQAEMYDLARHILRRSGYRQYEISNFAREGYRCRHNMAYWSGKNYVGFGPGAASYIDGVRFVRIASVDGYLDAQRNGKNTVEFLENLSSERAAAEAIVLGLRTSDGIKKNNIETRYGIKITDLCGEALERYSAEGLLEMDEDNIRLSDRAYYISNLIFRDIIR